MFTGTRVGLNVLDAVGTLLVRVQSNSTVKHSAWTGPKQRMHWIVGVGGIARMEWVLQAQEL